MIGRSITILQLHPDHAHLQLGIGRKMFACVYFSMKAHIGVDAESGVTHSLKTSTTRTHNSQAWDTLLHGDETSVWADKAYFSAEREAAFEGSGQFWASCARP